MPSNRELMKECVQEALINYVGIHSVIYNEATEIQQNSLRCAEVRQKAVKERYSHKYSRDR